MKKLFMRFVVAMAAAAFASIAVAQMPPPLPADPDPALVAALLGQREALFARGADMAQVSRDLAAAIREAEQLESQGRRQEALDRLKALERHAPLKEFPSFDVHMLSSWLSFHLGDEAAAQHHRARASAYREILWNRIGRGDRPEDPLRVVTLQEAGEWVKSRVSRVVDVRTMPDGRMMAFTYQGLATGNQPRVLYVQLDPRTQSALQAGIDVYAPIPIAQMRPQDKAMLDLARHKRERFLTDPANPFAQLEAAIRETAKAAKTLAAQGKDREALEKLRELERLRPLADIPTPEVLQLYSYLLGRNGQVEQQREMRGLIFGVMQAMAHGGDARSEQTAIEVLLVDEEYGWLEAKKLKPVRQQLVERGGRRYDVLSVDDAQGRRGEVFFDVTRMFERRGATLLAAAAPPAVVAVPPAAGFDKVWREAEAQFASPGARDYVERYTLGSTWNDGGVLRRVVMPSEKAIEECVTAVFPGPERVRLAFEVDGSGVVRRAHTDQEGFVHQCVKDKTAGLRIPAPPSAPFLLCTRFEKAGADRTVTQGCGPAPIAADCERQGSTRRCRFRAK